MPTKPQTFETRRAPVTEHIRNVRRADKKAVYNSARWQAMREIVMAEEPFCRGCQRNPASHIDHIQPLETHPELAFVRENLQGLCVQCHSRKTANEGKHMTAHYVVTGPPGSGKTTWVNDHRKPGDLVWDADRICDCLFAMPTYPRPQNIASFMNRLREGVIAAAPCEHMFIIITNEDEAARVAGSLFARLVVMPRDREERCHSEKTGRGE